MAKGELLGQFEIHVMLALAALGDEASGVPIQRLLEERTGRAMAMGAIYGTLGRLHDKGLVRYRWSESRPVPGGKARKLFTLTATGARELREATSMLSRMQQGLPEFGGSR
jgi:DNA-binding PadR family transcriptional regulator